MHGAWRLENLTPKIVGVECDDTTGSRNNKDLLGSMGEFTASFAVSGRQNKDDDRGVQDIRTSAPAETDSNAHYPRDVIESVGDANVNDGYVGKRAFSEPGSQLDSHIESLRILRMRTKRRNSGDCPQQVDAVSPCKLAQNHFTVRSSSCNVRIREARIHDFAAVASLLHQHLRSLVLPCVFFWICGHARDFGSLVLLMILFVQPLRAVAVVISFLLVLVFRAFWELEQYAVRGSADLAAFETTYLNSSQNLFLVAEVDKVCSMNSSVVGETMHRIQCLSGNQFLNHVV